MRLKKTTLSLFLLLAILMIHGNCGSDDGMADKSSDNFILSFVLEEFDPIIEGNVNEDNKTVIISVPFGTDVSNLRPTITLSDKASIVPSSGQVVDFSTPQTFTVTAQDGSTKEYTVTASTLPNSESRILSFAFNNLTPPVTANLDEENNLIWFNLPPGTSPYQLSPTIKISENASIVPQSNLTMDFDEPQTYTVTAQDASEKAYNTHLVIPQRALNEKPAPPLRLCMFFGTPGNVNGSDGDVYKAMDEFIKFDIIVFGDGLWQTSHDRHLKAKEIIALLKNEKPEIQIFGYANVGFGALGQNLSQEQLELRVDGLKALGADGVFADKFGSDYEVTTARQNTFIDYAHEQGMAVFANSTTVSDVLNERTHLRGYFGDYYLLENFFAWDGGFSDFNTDINRAQDAYYYSKLLGVKIAAVTTDLPWNLHEQSDQTDNFKIGWYATAMHNFDAFQFTDTYFTVGTLKLYFYPNPIIDYGSNWLDYDWTRKISDNRYERSTDTHKLFIEGGDNRGSGGHN